MKDLVSDSVRRQAAAAASLVRELQSDDDDLNHDMVEGETGLFEAVEVALSAINECEILIAGIKDAEAKLQSRRSRASNRAQMLRGLIDQAFQMASVKSHVFPTATITTKGIPQKLIVTDESKIPSKFFVAQPPKLDKSALLAAAKGGPIDGAELSNGGTTIQIRRS